ncbi:MAG TPA: hypothetical protein VM618_06870, partial [Acidimicrobiia bacterium]|nr:hypothetical protein [Acidimicrobiia bacterium]
LRETVQFIGSLISTMTDAHDKLYLEKADFVRTIPISNLGVKTTEFDLTATRADALYAEGRRAAEEFLATWDFAAYISSFRSGAEPPSRREDVAAELHA